MDVTEGNKVFSQFLLSGCHSITHCMKHTDLVFERSLI